MKIIFNKDKRAELSKLAKENGTTLKVEMAKVRKEAEKEARVQRQDKKQKMLLARLHRFDAEKQLVHTTRQERLKKVVRGKVDGLNTFKKQIDLSEERYLAAKEVIENEFARNKRLAEKREKRKANRNKQYILQTEAGKKALEQFLLSEKKRKDKKEEKRSKYSGQKKEKVAPRALTAEQLERRVQYRFDYLVFNEENKPIISHSILKTIVPNKMHIELAELDKKVKDIENHAGIKVMYPIDSDHSVMMVLHELPLHFAERAKELLAAKAA